MRSRAGVGPVDVAEGDAAERRPGVMRRRLKLPRGLLQDRAAASGLLVGHRRSSLPLSSRRPWGHDLAHRKVPAPAGWTGLCAGRSPQPGKCSAFRVRYSRQAGAHRRPNGASVPAVHRGQAAGGGDTAGRARWLSGTPASGHRPPAPQSMRSANAVSVPGPGRSCPPGTGAGRQAG